MSKVIDRLLNYVKIETTSDENSETVPSSSKEKVLAEVLVKELKEIGMQDVSMDENGYVMATLPSNTEKEVPAIGFIAHMDTSPDMCGKDVNPQFVENYDGKDIILNGEKNIVLSPKDFPELKNYIGKTLITTDGNTLLGADDKAGVAEIMTAVEYFIEHPEIKHGTVKVAFTPDEEIGKGPDHFDVKKFNTKLAYTVDGGAIGELECENFNAAGAKITVNGRNVHPGYAKNKMINSMLIANEIISMFPEDEVPEKTEKYEGFYHLIDMKGEVEKTTLAYIIRDFDKDNYEKRKQKVKDIVASINKKYGENTASCVVRDQYKNMKEMIEPVKYVVDIAFKAMEKAGVVPKVTPIRGGTDGAQISFMGIPTPNLFTGGENFHGKFEYIPTFAMEKAVEVIIKITELYAEI